MAEWELSKENIQPLKHGRKMATLNNILQVSSEEFIIQPDIYYLLYLEEELPIPGFVLVNDFWTPPPILLD